MGSVLAPFFNIGFNLATLQSSGKVDSFIDKFITFLKGKANTSALSIRHFARIWSIPVALLIWRLSKIFLTTSSDTFEKSLVIGYVS